MRAKLPVTAIALLVAATGAVGSASAQSAPFLGQLMLTGANFCPSGWAPAEGQVLPISQNEALFNVLGTTYGGDGKLTFALPKLAAPKTGMTWCVALRGVYPSRS